MTAISKAAEADVKPLEGSVIRRGTLGAIVTAPGPVTQQSDGKWDHTDTSAVQLNVAIPLQSGVDGDVVDLVMLGPVVALSGATPGAAVYGSDTAGNFDDAAGTKGLVIGRVEAATVLYVQPQVIDFA